jgi:NitT/TauT family transport system substrate-binding protein
MKLLKVLVSASMASLMVVTTVITASCSGPSQTTPQPTAQTAVPKLEEIRLVGTIGPMSIPFAYMVEHNSLGSVANKTTFSTWANPTQLQAIVSGGQGDFVSLPTNSAAIFYNKGIGLRMLDVSIWNILYLVTPDAGIKSAADLKGKRVVVPYQAAIPDAIFQTVLKGEGIDLKTGIDLFYAADPVQASQLLLSGQEKYVLLSEPSATSVIIKGKSAGKTFLRALNMETEWKKATGGKSTPIAGTVVLGGMRDRPDVIKVFQAEYDKALKWMLANPKEAGQLGAKVLAEQGFTAEALTESMQSTVWREVPAGTAQPDMEAFFNALSQVSPNFIGGKLPDAAFYYGK